MWPNITFQSSKADNRGLRALGELGKPNLQLIYAAIFLWCIVGLLTMCLRRKVLQLASFSGLLTTVLLLLIATRNLFTEQVVTTVKYVLQNSGESFFTDGQCWSEAFYLVIVGLCLFNGSLTTYRSLSPATGNMKLISITTILFHIFFIFLCILSIAPLLPDHLNLQEISLRKEIGYFPLPLISLTLSKAWKGDVVCCLVYLFISISGFNLLLGLCANISTCLIPLATRNDKTVSIATIPPSPD